MEPTLYSDPALVGADYSTYAQPNPLVSLVWFAVWVLMLVSWAMLFKKAGEQWWKAIIPIYNLYVLLKLVQRPGWWLILYFIPLVNLVAMVIVTFDTAKAFGKGALYGVGLIFLPVVFYPLLAFGDAQYVHGSMASAAPAPAPESTPDQGSAPAQPTEQENNNQGM